VGHEEDLGRPVIYFLWKGRELHKEARLAGHAFENCLDRA